MTHWPIATHQKLTIASILPYRKFIKWREKSFNYFGQIISISTSFDLIWLAHIICWFIISSFNTPLSTEIIMKIHIRSISGQYTDRIDWFVKKSIIKSKVYDSDWMYTILTEFKIHESKRSWLRVNDHDKNYKIQDHLPKLHDHLFESKRSSEIWIISRIVFLSKSHSVSWMTVTLSFRIVHFTSRSYTLHLAKRISENSYLTRPKAVINAFIINFLFPFNNQNFKNEFGSPRVPCPYIMIVLCSGLATWCKSGQSATCCAVSGSDSPYIIRYGHYR